MGNGTAGLWVIPVRGEFQYPMGNGTFSAEVHRHTRISFNTLWEMEPRARNLLALGKKFQYPMGNGTTLNGGSQWNFLVPFQYPMGNGTIGHQWVETN